jgi:hypothetical protein
MQIKDPRFFKKYMWTEITNKVLNLPERCFITEYKATNTHISFRFKKPHRISYLISVVDHFGHRYYAHNKIIDRLKRIWIRLFDIKIIRN